MALPHPRTEAVGEINTLLGKGSEFEGKLTFEGTVRVDGKLAGEIFSDDVLVVGEGAEVKAEIDVGEIIVQGTIIGNIRAKRSVEIHGPGKVRGDITTPSLQIDRGVVFEGRCYMEGVTEAKMPKAATAPLSAFPSAVTSPSPNLPGIPGNGPPKDKDSPIVKK